MNGDDVLGVLFFLDGGLVEDACHSDDPDLVRPLPSARSALDLLRRHRIPVGVVHEERKVDRARVQRVRELLGSFDVWRVCPHSENDRCDCRPPAPGLVLDAAARLGVPPYRLVVIGGCDVGAAMAAGAHSVLVAGRHISVDEISSAPDVAPDPRVAVARLLEATGAVAWSRRALAG